MEFVEDDGGDAAEGGVGEQPAGEDAFGDEAEAGARAGDVLEADLVADCLAEGSLSSSATRRAARRAARRRGSRTTISPGTRSRSAGGTRVVLPAPGGASRTRLGCAGARRGSRVEARLPGGRFSGSLTYRNMTHEGVSMLGLRDRFQPVLGPVCSIPHPAARSDRTSRMGHPANFAELPLPMMING